MKNEIQLIVLNNTYMLDRKAQLQVISDKLCKISNDLHTYGNYKVKVKCGNVWCYTCLIPLINVNFYILARMLDDAPKPFLKSFPISLNIKLPMTDSESDSSQDPIKAISDSSDSDSGFGYIFFLSSLFFVSIFSNHDLLQQ